jgi:hypothetical protein
MHLMMLYRASQAAEGVNSVAFGSTQGVGLGLESTTGAEDSANYGLEDTVC